MVRLNKNLFIFLSSNFLSNLEFYFRKFFILSIMVFQSKHIHVLKIFWMQYLARMQTALMMFIENGIPKLKVTNHACHESCSDVVNDIK